MTLDQCLGANRPLVFVTCESDVEVLRHILKNYPDNDTLVYSSTIASLQSLSNYMNPKSSQHAQDEAMSTLQTLDRILTSHGHRMNPGKRSAGFTTYIFLDCDMWIHDAQNVRKVKDILHKYTIDEEFTVNLIMLSGKVCVPMALERLAEMVNFDLPSDKELKDLSDNLAKKLELAGKEAPSEEVINNLKGMTLFEVEQSYLQSHYLFKKVQLDFIRDFKKNAIAKTDLLSLLDTSATFDDIGGLDKLKQWVIKSAGGWTVDGKKFGLPLLKGVLLVGLPGCGKAQPLDSTVFTPSGPVRMGDIRVGDTVLTPNAGTGVKVAEIFPQGIKDVYRVTFEDGASVECTSDHLWKVQIRDKRHVADQWVVPTSFLMDKVVGRYDKKNNLYIDVPKMARFEMKSLPIDPYVLGVLIGDGCLKNTTTFVSMDSQIINKVRAFIKEKGCNLIQRKGRNGRAKTFSISKNGGSKNKVCEVLKRLGLFDKGSHEKFIPQDYLYASHKQRIALLRGLMDTDGSAYSNHIEFTTTSKQLSMDFKLLVESLGGLCFTKTRESYYKKDGIKVPCKVSYRSLVRININPFSIPRKKQRVKPRTKYVDIKRVITKIEKIGEKQCQCIAISDIENLYMTDHYVVTHNSLSAKALGNQWSLPVVDFDPSRVFSSRVGDSETNMRRVLQIVENLSPCIMMIDEIEKGLAGLQSSSYSDSGVTARVIRSFLVWMQECKKPVFTVATANNISNLPPEMISRFDEVFFVNLPQIKERKDIFNIHIKKLGRDPKNFDINALAEASQDLSGREIEQVLKEAMYSCFHDNIDLKTDAVLHALKHKTTLVTTMAEQLKNIIKWVGWDPEKQDGLRARYASITNIEDVNRVQTEIDALLKEIESGPMPGDDNGATPA